MINPFGQTQINPSQLGALGQALMQQGYIPNSGMGGVAIQLLNAYLGQKMQDKANSQDIAASIGAPATPQINLPGLNVPNLAQGMPADGVIGYGS